MELEAKYKTKVHTLFLNDIQKNFSLRPHNSLVVGDFNGNTLETPRDRNLLKRKSFPHEVFSPIFSGPRKAPPPTLTIAKKRLQVVTEKGGVIEKTKERTNDEFKNLKANNFLPIINPNQKFKHNSVKSLSANPLLTQRAHLSLLTRNELYPPNYSELTNQCFHKNSPSVNNMKIFRLKPLVGYVMVENKKPINILDVSKNPFIQKLNLLKGSKRMKYAKEKVKEVEILDKIEEDSESIVNVTFGK